MTKPVFRNPDKFQVLGYRDWLRENLPRGSEGCVVEDLDLVPRVYGSRYNTDGRGKFMLVELKFGNSWIGVAQKKTFGLIDRVLKRGDPSGKRYCGYYVVQYSNEDWDKADFRVNHRRLSRKDFLRFLNFDGSVLDEIPEIRW